MNSPAGFVTTLASGLPLALATMRPSFQLEGEAEALSALLGDVVAGISWLLLAVLPFSPSPLKSPAGEPADAPRRGRYARLGDHLLPLLVGNVDDHLRRPLESEALRAG